MHAWLRLTQQLLETRRTHAMWGEVSQTGWTFGVSGAFALSAVALIGYLFGRTQRFNSSGEASLEGQEEIQRATRIARQLERIADDLRQDLSLHRTQVERFKLQLRRAEGEAGDEAWRRLREEAESMVGPTLQLVSQLSTAYDKIRQQSQSLANFTGGRTDPLTGLANGRSLEEHLEMLLKSRNGGGGESAVVVVSLDDESADREEQDLRVRRLGQHLALGLRGEDFAARYGVDDFVVVLPATSLAGAGVFGTRLRKTAGDQLGVSISCGLAESMPADTPKSLLARADSAAYSARAAGPRRQFVHTGVAIRPDTRVQPVAEKQPAAQPTAKGPPKADRPPVDAAPKPVATALPGPPIEGGSIVSPID
ncbi:MAG: diguanylate cyclase [Planctomycetota bacterium]